MRPLTLKTPKCLVPIAGKPLLEIWYRQLEHHGITDVLVNTHHLADQVRTFIETFETSIRTQIIFESELLGSGGTLLKNRDFVENESFFWIVYSDNLTSVNLNAFIHFHKQNGGLLTMGLFRTKKPEQCGIAELDADNRITRFIEKPGRPESDLANAGLMVASPEIFHYIPEQYPCDLSFDVIPRLVGNMYGYIIKDLFIDIGTPENYQMANDLFRKHRSEFEGE